MFKKVCIIDDDELFVFITKMQIEDCHFAESIVEFPDGNAAFKFLSESKENELPSIIFLDINMNFMSGWELLDALMPLNVLHKIQVYMTSSSIDPADLEKAKSHPNVIAFIPKPLTEEKLRALMV